MTNLKTAMTCQCCGRKYQAKTGTMAHHGYQRPGGGWQTASCGGAKVLPFEVSRDALGALLVRLTGYQADQVALRAEAAAERTPVTVMVTDRSKPRDVYGRPAKKALLVTRENFAEVDAQNDGAFRQLSLYDFDRVKDRDLAIRDRDIRNLAQEIEAQQARFDGWKQTHKRDGKDWVGL